MTHFYCTSALYITTHVLCSVHWALYILGFNHSNRYGRRANVDFIIPSQLIGRNRAYALCLTYFYESPLCTQAIVPPHSKYYKLAPLKKHNQRLPYRWSVIRTLYEFVLLGENYILCSHLSVQSILCTYLPNVELGNIHI